MSENSKSAARKQTIISYDHKKVIKGIDLSTIYITSLQNIVTKKISENPDTILTIGQTFKWHANKQGLQIETEIDVEEGVFKKTVEKLKEGVDIKEDMLKLQAMLEKGQQSS